MNELINMTKEKKTNDYLVEIDFLFLFFFTLPYHTHALLANPFHLKQKYKIKVKKNVTVSAFVYS
jgi:hypothetical protein